MRPTRHDGHLNNVLPFPSLKHMPPDTKPPTLLRGLITFVVLAIAGALFALTIWAFVNG